MLSRSLRSKLRCSRRSLAVASKSLSSEINSPLGSSGNGGIEASSLLATTNYVPRRLRSKFAYPEGMTDYENDWVEEPEYPKIDPETHQWNVHRRQRLQDLLDLRAKITNASCPETKNLELNMPRQYGYKLFNATEDCFEYDSLNAYKFVTRTHVASNTQLPSQYTAPELNEKVEYFKNKLREPLLDALAFELDISRSYDQDFNALPHLIELKRSQTLIPQVNRVILSVLGQEIDYLQDCQVDVSPNVQAFWKIGGIQPSSATRSRRKGAQEIKGHNKARYVKPEDPIEDHIQYIGNALVQVRCKDPPENFVLPSDPLCQRSLDTSPDTFPHFLHAYGFRRPDDCRFASIIPGHWSGDVHRCNLLAFHPRNHLVNPNRTVSEIWSAPEEKEEALLSQAMLVSFGRLLSQAFFHGFDQFVDLEYPFSTQTVITNGVDWSFFAYQLNTMKLDQLSLAKNQKQNVIWGTQSESIFDKEKKGELNDFVISNLLRFYLNPPRPIQAENPTPYLGRRLQEWDDDFDRAVIFYNFRNMVCQRIYRTDSMISQRPPETYEYEKIYKVYHNAMPLDKRLKHFEFPPGFPGSDPWNEPFKLRNPLHVTRGITRLIAEVEEKKEKEAAEAAKIAEATKYGVKPRPSRKK